jgi:hypothetical protein
MLTVDDEVFFPITTLPKTIDEGVAVTAVTPTPVRLSFNELFFPESMTVREPLLAPNAAGVNVTEMVQLEFAPNVAGPIGQLLDSLKSAKLVEILLIVITDLCEFLNVITLAALGTLIT